MANYEIDILVNKKPIKKFYHNGDTFIEGRKGSKFEIQFTNNTWNPIEVVISVDGLSVIDGKPSGVTSEGYLVPARDNIIIPGWRLNNNSVAEFMFNDKERSYSNLTGQGKSNAGVIGFMIFKEKIKKSNIDYNISYPWDWWEYKRPYPYIEPLHIWHSSGTGKAPINTTIIGSGMTAKNDYNKISESIESSNNLTTSDNEIFNLGVDWGKKLDHNVTVTNFTRNNPNDPDKIIVLYYDSRKGLENRGIKIVYTKKKRVKKLPNPFPTYNNKNPGAIPPPGWKNK